MSQSILRTCGTHTLVHRSSKDIAGANGYADALLISDMIDEDISVDREEWGVGMALGMGTGIAFGVALGNIGTGIALGAGIGVAFAVALASEEETEDEMN